jgi:Cu+-exporting ATPase
MSVAREIGSTVYGSTVNQKGLLYVQVSSVGSESALAQIVQLVEGAYYIIIYYISEILYALLTVGCYLIAAQMDKAPIQAYADVIAGIFTPTVLCLAFCTFSVWFFLSKSNRIPVSWYAEAGYEKDPLLFSLLFCISVVVISCPCALGKAMMSGDYFHWSG